MILNCLDVMTSCCFFVSLSSLCFATDEDGRAVEKFCNTLFKCINYNLHEEMFCFNVVYLDIILLYHCLFRCNSYYTYVCCLFRSIRIFMIIPETRLSAFPVNSQLQFNIL